MVILGGKHTTLRSDEPFRNIITGQLFSDTIYNDLIGAYEKGKELYLVFTDERLKPESKNINSCQIEKSKSTNKAVKIKYKDQVTTLERGKHFHIEDCDDSGHQICGHEGNNW